MTRFESILAGGLYVTALLSFAISLALVFRIGDDITLNDVGACVFLTQGVVLLLLARRA